ncbi:MAG TPA: di-heme oxidoredictase family protein [Burkholderiales bacterium]
MPVNSSFFWLAAPLGLVAALGAYAVGQERLEEIDLSAGSFTTTRADKQAFSEPAAVLDTRQRQLFMAGRSVFQRQWASVNSLNGDWGLGPTFVADRCSACHVNTGRGKPPESGEQMLSMLVRVSIPGADEHGAPKPHPNYGDQLQNRALDGTSVDLAYAGAPVPREADIYLDWEARTVAFPDGETVELRSPKLRIENLNFGPLGDDVMTSTRNAQPIFGLGLLEAVPEDTLKDIARKQQAAGVNGRLNYVWDSISKRPAAGRFGWKANQATLKQQIVSAAIGDMGVASKFSPEQNCPPVQDICARLLPGNVPELGTNEIDTLELWLRGLAVPARRNMRDPQVQRGGRLFAQAQCAVCHVPELKTGTSVEMRQLSGRTFRAYTDMLLHDMGEELADGRPDFLAGPRDWRTPPLWGLGLSPTVSGSGALLHDGRARNVTEAILWHGGEADAARETFRNMPKADRDALARFVESI